MCIDLGCCFQRKKHSLIHHDTVKSDMQGRFWLGLFLFGVFLLKRTNVDEVMSHGSMWRWKGIMLFSWNKRKNVLFQ